MVDSGHTHEKIGEILGVPRTTVSDWAKRANIEAPEPFWTASGRRSYLMEGENGRAE